MANCKIIKINPYTTSTNLSSTKKITIDDLISKSIDSLGKNVENYVRDRGYFSSFSETFDTDKIPEFFGKKVALFIERDEAREGRAFLGVSVLHPTMAVERPTYLMNGTKDKILEFINNKDFKAQLKDTIMQLSESLKS